MRGDRTAPSFCPIKDTIEPLPVGNTQDALAHPFQIRHQWNLLRPHFQFWWRSRRQICHWSGPEIRDILLKFRKSYSHCTWNCDFDPTICIFRPIRFYGPPIPARGCLRTCWFNYTYIKTFRWHKRDAHYSWGISIALQTPFSYFFIQIYTSFSVIVLAFLWHPLYISSVPIPLGLFCKRVMRHCRLTVSRLSPRFNLKWV